MMHNKAPLTLFLGGTRSGKSQRAEQCAAWHMAQKPASSLLYIATASPLDDSMHERIERHQERRPKNWHTHEIQTHLAQNIAPLLEDKEGQNPYNAVLLDCVTLWITNILFSLGENPNLHDFEHAIKQEVRALIDLMHTSSCHWILVSGETGLGGVGASRLQRLFDDGLGLANQILAKAAKEHFFCIAGLFVSLETENIWSEA